MSKNKRKGTAHSGPHKYQRIAWKSKTNEPYIVFKCMLPGCTHYVPRELVVGNETLCWRCGGVFQMTQGSTYLKKPHCSNCTKTKGDVEVDDVAANLQRLLGGL